MPTNLVPVERIEQAILLLRGHKVMLDSDLAALFGVETKALNRAVKRNVDRFPPDFMFQLTVAEMENLRCQIGTSRGHGGRRYPPFAFTEHGVVMAANVLNSKRAIEASVFVVRAFVRLRQILSTHADLARKLIDLEKKYDHNFAVVFFAVGRGPSIIPFRLTKPPFSHKEGLSLVSGQGSPVPAFGQGIQGTIRNDCHAENGCFGQTGSGYQARRRRRDEAGWNAQPRQASGDL